MLGSIAAMLVGAWFYYSVLRSDRAAVSWAVSGVLVYFLVALLWTFLVTPSIKAAAGHNPSGLQVFMVSYLYIPVAALSAVLLDFLVNKRGGA